jgi:copper chaperone
MSENQAIVLSVSGMTCEGCANAVRRIVQKTDPQAVVQVDLASGRVEARTGASAETLAAAITKAGYPAKAA